MAVEIVMPKWGLSMQEGLISQWLKREGEPVQQGEPVLEVETEKITNVVEAPASGILTRILYPAGSTIAVTVPIAIIAAPGEALPETAAPPPAARAVGESIPAPAARAVGDGAPAGVVRAMPVARKLAKDHNLDLAAVQGSGPGGAITRADVERALAERQAPARRPTEKISFYSDGYKLDGLLFSPEGLAPGERRPAAVLCAGYTYVKTMVMPDIAKALTAAGYVALVFDYRGFGASAGPRWRLIPDEQVRDARAALTCLADQPHVDPARLAIVGLSLGGANALAASALDQRIGAVVAIEAPGDGQRWLRSLRRHWEWQQFLARLAADRTQRARTGESARVDPLDIVVPDPDSRTFLEAVYGEFPEMRCDLPLESAEALVEYRPEALAGRIAPRPLLLIHGDADRLVPVEEAYSIAAQAGQGCRLEVVPGMGHFDWVMPASPGFRRVADLVVDFIRAAFPMT